MATVTKQHMIDALRELPEDATVEDAMERLYVLSKIERGLADADAGRTVPQEEVERLFLKR